MSQVQAPLEFIPPQFDPFILRLCRIVMPWGRRLQSPIRSIEAENVHRLVELYRQFHAGEIRLLLAFRHPSVHDLFCMSDLMWRLLPEQAQRQRVSLPPLTHCHFLYDRGIPLWMGEWVGWLFSRLGGSSIQRGKLDRAGLRSARDLFTNGQFPLAAAPEGATNGHNELVSPLEPGVAQMGFWCLEDLQKSDRPERVCILPVGIQYSFTTPPWQALEALMSQLEASSGLLPVDAKALPVINSEFPSPREAHLYGRLIRLGMHLLVTMEEFYTTVYQRNLPGNTATLEERLPALLDVALQVAEEYFHLTSKGSVVDRCRRIEQAGWEFIYREDIQSSKALPPLRKGLADRVAEEANLRMWHMRLVENFVAVTGRYVREKPTAERFTDTLMLVRNTIARIAGDRAIAQPRLGNQRVRMTIGEPIWVSDRAEAYRSNRKAAIFTLTQDLQTALEATIIR